VTVVPDIWEGDNVPLNWDPKGDFNLRQWMGRHPPGKVETICQTAIKAMKEEYGVRKIGGSGYCLGAKYVCRLMAEGKGLDVGYLAHPSATTGDEVKGVAGPLAIAAAGKYEEWRVRRPRY
jgi:dienelactone hydrolase